VILLFCASLEKIPFTFSKWSHFLLKITIMYGSLLVKLNLRGPDLLRGFPICACVGGRWRHRSRAPCLEFSFESSEVRRAVHGISHLHTPITHTLYSLIKRQTHFCIVFIDHSDTCASFLASFSWNKHLVQQQRAWGEYVEFIQPWASVCSFVWLSRCLEWELLLIVKS